MKGGESPRKIHTQREGEILQNDCGEDGGAPLKWVSPDSWGHKGKNTCQKCFFFNLRNNSDF